MGQAKARGDFAQRKEQAELRASQERQAAEAKREEARRAEAARIAALPERERVEMAFSRRESRVRTTSLIGLVVAAAASIPRY